MYNQHRMMWDVYPEGDRIMAKSEYEEIIQFLTSRMSTHTPVLVLGAGFSAGAKNKDGKELPTGSALAQDLFDQLMSKNKKIDRKSTRLRYGGLQGRQV